MTTWMKVGFVRLTTFILLISHYRMMNMILNTKRQYVASLACGSPHLLSSQFQVFYLFAQLIPQLKDIKFQGYEVILVTSGAVGLGRQRLRYRRLANSSFADLQNPQNDFDGKACVAVGQSSLMGLYDAMFAELYSVNQFCCVGSTNVELLYLPLDVTSSQLLVTECFQG